MFLGGIDQIKRYNDIIFSQNIERNHGRDTMIYLPSRVDDFICPLLLMLL
jgi:hypothetical protein